MSMAVSQSWRGHFFLLRYCLLIVTNAPNGSSNKQLQLLQVDLIMNPVIILLNKDVTSVGISNCSCLDHLRPSDSYEELQTLQKPEQKGLS